MERAVALSVFEARAACAVGFSVSRASARPWLPAGLRTGGGSRSDLLWFWSSNLRYPMVRHMPTAAIAGRRETRRLGVGARTNVIVRALWPDP